MVAATEERLDFVIYGATGFTGKNTIPPVERLANENGRKLKWAIAGRSESKLKDALEEMGKRIGKDLNKTPIIIADVEDQESLNKMASQAKVILNTCGPFRFLGEPVVKACVENGTHYVDVSGEPEFIETMQLKYNDQAAAKKVFIVSACGFDSIPCDMGLVFLQEKFEGTLNSVETYLKAKEEGGLTAGPAINIGTWASLVHGIGGLANLRDIRAKLYPHRLPLFSPKLERRFVVHKNEINNHWSLPFLGSDRSVSLRSQRYFYEVEKRRPVQLQTYFCVDSFLMIIGLLIFGSIFSILSKFSFGRNLLLKYPRFFSAGVFSHENPSYEKMERAKFTLFLAGEGWTEKLDDCNKEPTTKPDKKMYAKVSGTNPGYGATTMMLAVSALMILEESNKMPGDGGVYPPGAAFAHTSMIEKLNSHGVTFEIFDKK